MPQPVNPAPTFKSSVDLVRVSAVVRNRKGRFVDDMSVRDFEVIDGGQARRISEFRHDESGVSVALLFDISGSMESRMPNAKEAAEHVLSWLNMPNDEAAVFTFDTVLDEVAPFTAGLQRLPAHMDAVTPFGATSLHDAIATLRTRLEPVLKPDGAGGVNPVNTESPFPIGQFIERGANRVDSMRDEVADILDRLCI